MRPRVLALVFAFAFAPVPVGDVSAEAPRVLALRVGSAEPYAVAYEALERSLAGTVELHVEEVDLDDSDEFQRIAALRPRVLVPFGTRAATWARQSFRELPIVFAMVLNPVNSGLVQSLAAPGAQVTGAALDISPELQFRVLRDLIGARRVAVLFDPAKTGLLIREAIPAARRVGIELIGVEVPNATALESALRGVDGSFDALWTVADSTVLARGVVNRVLLHTLDARIPYMGLSEQYVRAGALVALSASYAENGRLAAELVRRVVAGEPAGSIPVATPREVEIVVNPKTAQRLNLELTGSPALPIRELP